jgi:hypothetical protein
MLYRSTSVPVIRSLSFITPSFAFTIVFVLSIACSIARGQERPAPLGQNLEERVATLFAGHCVECHSGPDPQQGMSLSRDRFYSNIVARPSIERPDHLLAEPGAPDSSYLVMKLKGSPGIVGRRMPIAGPPLSNDQIATIAEWIASLPSADAARIASEPSSGRGVARPFGGWKLGDLPTTRMLSEGAFLFLVSHRFVPDVSSGIDGLFGLDGGANILFSFSYAPLDALLLTLARSNVGDDLELQARYRLFAQTRDGLPAAVAVAATADIETEEDPTASGRSRSRFALQLPISHQIDDGVGALLVPGILLNPAIDRDDESPLVTLGVGGQWRFYRFFSLFGEWTPIVAGYVPSTTFGFANRFDSWTAGLDIALGGHDFQILVGNSVGTAVDQYMRGGNLDIGSGDLRLGFNIYRILE